MNVKPVWARFLVPTLLSGIITYAKLFPLVVSLVPSFMAPSWLNDHICQVASSVVAGFLIGWAFLSYAMPAIVGLVSWVLLSRLPGQSSTRIYVTQFLMSVFAVITGKFLPGVTDRLLASMSPAPRNTFTRKCLISQRHAASLGASGPSRAASRQTASSSRCWSAPLSLASSCGSSSSRPFEDLSTPP